MMTTAPSAMQPARKWSDVRGPDDVTGLQASLLWLTFELKLSVQREITASVHKYPTHTFCGLRKRCWIASSRLLMHSGRLAGASDGGRSVQ